MTTTARKAHPGSSIFWRALAGVSEDREDKKPGARAAMRLPHFSPRTEEAYVGWMQRFRDFCGRRDLAELGPPEASAFLSSLASTGRFAAATQNQALAALLFLFREVWGRELPGLDGLVRAKISSRLPVVLSRMEGLPRLMATLISGAGLRVLEVCRLRTKDLDFDRSQLVVRQGKGDKDRVTMLPAIARPMLSVWLSRVRSQHERDLARGAGWFEMPNALERKLPNARREWPWQWVFPATRSYADPTTGQLRRHHLHETVVQRAVRAAALAAGLAKRVTCHAFRHSFATHLLEMVPTSAPCRSSSATPMSRRP